MNKDAPAIPAGQTGGSLFREIVRSKTWKRAFLFGAVAGPVAGAVNFAATAIEWPLRWLFVCLNCPLISLIEDPYYQFVSRTWSSRPWMHSGPWNYLLLAFICYWTTISLVLAPIYCFVRAGVFRRIRRDQVCRGALILGAGAGVLMGGLNFLAALDVDGPLANGFKALDGPGNALLDAAITAMNRPEVFEILQNASAEFICGFVLAIVYWATIGLFFATVFSFVRVLNMRNDGVTVGELIRRGLGT